MPEEVGTLYTFRDEHTENPQRTITVVYTNDAPQVREDQTSIPGRYVVPQLERIENPKPEATGAWGLDTTAGIAVELRGSASIRRLDFSDIRIEQRFDAKNERGQTIQRAGTLPPLLEENLFWPELQGSVVGQEWQSGKGLIHYSFYLPDGYYGPERAREAYHELCSRYQEEGLTEKEIAELVSLHIPNREFLSRWGFTNFYMGGHMGGQMAVNAPAVMGWIMKQHK